jgi:hypothetical protein
MTPQQQISTGEHELSNEILKGLVELIALIEGLKSVVKDKHILGETKNKAVEAHKKLVEARFKIGHGTTVQEEEKELDKLKKELEKLEGFFKVIGIEIRNLGLLDEQEIKELDIAFKQLESAYGLVMKQEYDKTSFANLAAELDKIENIVNTTERYDLWGSRSSENFGNRVETEIGRIKPTLDFLKTTGLDPLVQECEKQFRNIDQLNAYILGIRNRIQEDRGTSENIKRDARKLAGDVRTIISAQVTMNANPNVAKNIGKQRNWAADIVTMKAEVYKLMNNLTKGYQELREGYNLAKVIESNLKNLIAQVTAIKQQVEHGAV